MFSIAFQFIFLFSLFPDFTSQAVFFALFKKLNINFLVNVSNCLRFSDLKIQTINVAMGISWYP